MVPEFFPVRRRRRELADTWTLELAPGRPVAFLIGGASGIDEGLLGACDERLSLGTLTMPHQLARVVLVEQLYRALCLIRGHPYPH